MELRESTFTNVRVLAPLGRIDHRSAEDFQSALAPHLEKCQGDSCKIVLDLSQVEYMSSVGLRVLMMAAKQGRKQGGTIVIAGLGDTLREIFEISRFDRVFEIFPDVRAAVAGVEPDAVAEFEAQADAASPGAPPAC